MDIRILGAHNCETPTSSCVSLLIDGKLAVEAGGLTSHLTMEEQKNIDAIVITHNHMDHIRDIPALALNSFRSGTSIDIYSTTYACDAIKAHMLNDEIFPEFHKIPANKPAVSFQEIEPLAMLWIDGHAIMPVPVNHHHEAVGYQISDRKDKTIFFTGDTGPQLAKCWEHISPQLLIIDVTSPNEAEEFARQTGHLTPQLLEKELISFREIRGYFPDVLTIHMDAACESEIRAQLDVVEQHLDTTIDMAHEGIRLTV
jgi:ribonuclease BN (tRNA processing enzyme)